MCGKRKRDSTENIFSVLKILNFTDINAYLTGRFMYKCYTENVPGIFSDSSNVIMLSMVIPRDKVNIYMYPWKEVISLSFAYVNAV